MTVVFEQVLTEQLLHPVELSQFRDSRCFSGAGGVVRQAVQLAGMEEAMKRARSVLDFFKSARLRYIIWPAV